MSILTQRELRKMANDIEKGKTTEVEENSRRRWLLQAGLTAASGVFLYACGTAKDAATATPTCDTKSAADGIVADGAILNVALGLEHEAIAIYTAAAGLPSVTGNATVLDVAGSFLAHHKEHRAALIAAIGGLKALNAEVAVPVTAKADADYIPAGVSASTSLQDVLLLAMSKEMIAAQAYLSVIKSFSDKNLAATAGLLAGDEAAHYGVYRAVLLTLGMIPSARFSASTVIPGSLPSVWNDQN